jgi:hypothetical protein
MGYGRQLHSLVRKRVFSNIGPTKTATKSSSFGVMSVGFTCTSKQSKRVGEVVVEKQQVEFDV